MTSIGTAFENCSGLTSVKVESGNTKYDSRNNCNAIIESSTNTLICGCKNTTIPNSVTSIGNYAFSGCSGLTSVTIPNSVTSIGFSAFYGCSGLTSVTIPNSVTSIYTSAFWGCSGLTSVTIPNSVTSIGSQAFWGCSSITDFYCLAEIIPTTGNNFFNQSNISNATLHVPASAVESYSSTSPWSGFGNIVALVASDIIEDKNHITFADMNVRALCMANWDTDRNGSLSYVEAAAVTDLGEVFADNADITSFDELQYFTGLTGIDDNAFMGCSNLASVTLPENISSIGSYAFYGCNALTTFTIPQGVSEVGTYAFRGCTGLTDVYCLPLDVPVTASNAFNNSNIGNATLHVVVSSYNAYKNASPWKNFKNMLGDIPAPCAAPVISYEEGKIVFTCDTEGVEFQSNISSADMGDRNSNEIDISAAYTITVYATKEGYNPSETVTATLCWIETESVDAVATGTLEIAAVPVLVKSRGGVITVEGVANGTTVSVYTTGGMLVDSATAVDRTATVSTTLPAGTVVVVKIGEKAVKIVVR